MRVPTISLGTLLKRVMGGLLVVPALIACLDRSVDRAEQIVVGLPRRPVDQVEADLVDGVDDNGVLTLTRGNAPPAPRRSV